jgi:GTP-binding protein EngB required for normal cell division
MVHNNDNDAPVSDSPLPSTFEDITDDCPQIRILVLGKTGCGKSSLINKVFGVELAEISHDLPGKARINAEFRHSSNNRFILHDSEGFEPGEDAKFDTVKHFIEDRTRSEMSPEARLHVIWICISVSVANDRAIETGVEEIFKMSQERNLPAIVIFTKYDKLVTKAILEAGPAKAHLRDEEMWQYGKDEANKDAKNLCIRPWREAVGKAPLMVSTKERFKETIQNLIVATDLEIQRQTGISSHTEASSLNFAAAQRLNNGIKIDASIDIGRLNYWSKLLSKSDFTGKQLRQCLYVIHRDIVSVWNIRNSSYLAGDDFRVKMTVLVDDLVANPNTPTPSDGLTVATVAALASAALNPAGIVILVVGSAVLIAKWIFDFYQNTSHNIACIMAYIVDLTILMHRLSEIEMSEQRVISTLQDYARSGEIAQVHNDIRAFSGHMPSLRLEDNDAALTEIIRLIEQHCVRSSFTDVDQHR